MSSTFNNIKHPQVKWWFFSPLRRVKQVDTRIVEHFSVSFFPLNTHTNTFQHVCIQNNMYRVSTEELLITEEINVSI